MRNLKATASISVKLEIRLKGALSPQLTVRALGKEPFVASNFPTLGMDVQRAGKDGKVYSVAQVGCSWMYWHHVLQITCSMCLP